MPLPEEKQQIPKHDPTGRDDVLPQKWQPSRRLIAWSVAGFDPSSGAGVTADLTTFAAHGLFGCAALTATTVQNTTGVFSVAPIAPVELASTLLKLAEDLPPSGIKIGMLATEELADTVAAFLGDWKHRFTMPPVVVLDPVLRSSSGATLYPDAGLTVLLERLLPLVDWITPNWAELGVLAGKTEEVRSEAEAVECAQSLAEQLPRLGVIATGGDQHEPTDLLIQPGRPVMRLRGQRVETTSTHGTGCAFASALLSHLLQGKEPLDAACNAKLFVTGALESAPGLGHGRGPMDLLWPLRRSQPERPQPDVATLRR